MAERAREQPGLLEDLAALGPFFAVQAHPPDADPAPGWRSFADLTGPAGLCDRIHTVRDALAAQVGRPSRAIELRAAASVAHLGLVARLVAPALAAEAGGRYQLNLSLGGLWWRDETGGPLPLSVPAAPTSTPAEPSRLLDEVITPVTVTAAGVVRVSARVLWGNVASAVNGAANQVAATRPDMAPAAWATAAAFFRHPSLSAERSPPGLSFRRSSCCLIYRLAPGRPGDVCGDCILGRRPGQLRT